MAKTTSEAKKKKERTWSPHIWSGTDLGTWLKMLFRHRFAIAPRHWFDAAFITWVCPTNTVLKWVQNLLYGKKLARMTIHQPPIFILGHWRSGTTLLHELLVLDERFTFPTTFECMVPHHFLLSEKIFTKWGRFLMPHKRPMDNMALGWERPQEDEFALCNMGVPSTYLTIAFPNHGQQCREYLDLQGLSESEITSWKNALIKFMKSVLFFKPQKRLVLKSPTHTARVRTLLEMFPEAKFVHIIRDPFVVFPSTLRLWKSLYEKHGLQTPNLKGLEEHVFETFVRMYRRFEEDRPLIPEENFFEIKYEDLVKSPLEKVREIYAHFRLGEFENVLPALQKYLRENADYQTNRYELSPQLKEAVLQHWGDFIKKHGYLPESPA